MTPLKLKMVCFNLFVLVPLLSEPMTFLFVSFAFWLSFFPVHQRKDTREKKRKNDQFFLTTMVVVAGGW
jgi:hypothetical protein